MLTRDFHYALPQEAIAQTPIEPRDHSRLLVFDRKTGIIAHHHFYDLPQFLRAGDALVINETRTLPARLMGTRATGGSCELLLLKRLNLTDWEVICRPAKKLLPGAIVQFGDALTATILATTGADGGRVVRFTFEGAFEPILARLGAMPLPPYIHETLQDPARYNTVYAEVDGSAAAPTAGLHFTERLLNEIKAMGVSVVPILLHVGLGTFRPVSVETVEGHTMHAETYEVTPDASKRLNEARQAGGRIVCVGTTSVRTLETVTDADGIVHAGSGETSIFITPGYRFKAVDALITNFHLPESTLLMLVSALMGRENALNAYQEALVSGYRFFSFGDAMLIC